MNGGVMSMKGAVVYHSQWGNCRQVAEKIAEGLREAGHEANLLDVASKEGLDRSLEFIAAGSGTRIGKMTGAIHRFIKKQVKEEWQGRPFVAFGTGMLDVREKGQKQSADRIYGLLEEKGLKPLAPAYKAAVTDLQGPLADGELDAAFEFAKKIGAALGGGGDSAHE